MAVLADHISVHGRFARSVNVERDADRVEPLEGYIVTACALDVVERIATTAVSGQSGGAWSVTGPYGSGKSSLALLLDATLGPATTMREFAWKLIAEASPRLGKLLLRTHEHRNTSVSGFHRGVITANREPLGHTVLRALHAAVLRRYGGLPSTSKFPAANSLRGALEDLSTSDRRRTGPSSTATVQIAECLARDAPLLLIIDEFGKNLEAIQGSSEADPYLLQQLAEAGQGSGLPLFVVTLQHLSLDDHLAEADSPRRKEWAKVKGRFEDIAYVESPRQMRAMISTVFEIKDKSFQDRINRWAQHHATKMQLLGIAELVDPKVVASYYPLHPLTAMILPELCGRYGQHERTLFSFLASGDSVGVASFLSTAEIPNEGLLPCIGLDAVYDYFVTHGSPTIISATRSSRWTEIATRLRDIHGLTLREARMAKAIALLNLVSTSGTIRASSSVLALTDSNSQELLNDLESAGIVIYRDFADEYRIWEGTDVDIRHLFGIARQRTGLKRLVEVLSSVDNPMPVVAARHSSKHHVLRVFARRYADADEPIEPIDSFSPYDGEVLLVVSSHEKTPRLSESFPAAKPIVAAIPRDLTTLEDVARDIAAVTEVLGDPAVETDWVARRELGERLAEMRSALEHAFSETFSAETCRWVLLGDSDEIELPAGRGTAPLSAAADIAYPSTPTVRNEMLNRTHLTSQGAKARRLLLSAMIEHNAAPGLGLVGHGPEVAMYRAFLKRTGLHGHDARNETMIFRKPTDPSLQEAWKVIQHEFNRAKARRINLRDIYAALLSPPIGMKLAVIPVFITASLLAYSNEIAIYEHGTFKPLLSPDVSERMVRNPGHFDVKHFSNTTGARRQVVSTLADHLGVRPSFRKHRVANVLAIVGHLVSKARKLDNFTLRTSNLKPATKQARDAIVSAVEPDLLLFDKLPAAFGLPSVPVGAEIYGAAETYAQQVATALDELGECQQRLLTDLLDLLLETSAETTRLALAGQAAALENEVINPAVRAFILALARADLTIDTEWIKAIATVVANKAPTEWTDDDVARFRLELPQQIAAFQRLIALHADRRAEGDGPFSALRVIITRPDGSEHVRLVGIDQDLREQVDTALLRVLEELTEITGSQHRAHNALLALLGERLFPERNSKDHKMSFDIANEKQNHG